MRMFTIIFFLLLAFTGIIYSQGDVCPDGMTAYWKFDEQIVPTIFEDFYGDNFGFSDNNKYPTPMEGLVGNAMFFNGESEIYVNPNTVFDFDTTESFSVETWVKTEVTPEAPSVFIAKYAGTGKMSWWLGYDNQARAMFSIRDNSGNSIEFPSIATIADNQWHHVVGVYNRATGMATIYVDGIKDNQVFKPFEDDFVANKKIDIGHQASGSHFFGWIDETAVYDKVLNPIDIANHHLNGLGGRGFCDSVIVSVDDELVIESFKLYQNYPNPFNPETTIKYELPKTSNISLEIYSSIGEKIAVLEKGAKEAGVHSIKFNADNLTSGVYFYKLNAANFTEVKKLLLMK